MRAAPFVHKGWPEGQKNAFPDESGRLPHPRFLRGQRCRPRQAWWPLRMTGRGPALA